MDIVDEQIDATGQAFLGLTGRLRPLPRPQVRPDPAARLLRPGRHLPQHRDLLRHDPLVQSQRPSQTITLPASCGLPPGTSEKLSASERERIQKQIDSLNKQIADATDPIRRIFPTAQLAQLRSRLASFDADGNPKLLAMGTRDKPTTPNGFTPKRGFEQRPSTITRLTK